ncbi:MAG: HD family phosphohydrolase, partial [Hungatella sp.]
MKRYKMTAEELRIAGEWAADETWVEQKEYAKNTEYLDCVRDILDDPIFRSMDQYLQHGDTTCKAHCIQVSYLAYQICKAWGWDYRSVARAG